jgi:hypothetical protein
MLEGEKLRVVRVEEGAVARVEGQAHRSRREREYDGQGEGQHETRSAHADQVPRTVRAYPSGHRRPLTSIVRARRARMRGTM